MSAPAIQSALQQLHTLAAQAAGQSAQGATAAQAVGQGGFAAELRASIQRINELQQTASSKAMALQSGAPGVELSDVMVDMQKASIAMQMGVQVRNRLITAYKDVMNMQV
ncbi:flagellar hook-basal body complex protein FliE [Pseudomonas sp. A-1]|uniref:flagellar hook-basal body complex protein FliE n=1 Tax=unclassified Pseudomonas TaxID=196821 RepID=UPI0010A5E940|nr:MULTISPECIES: flagellar hook-basal body complex protein FliE [unclassified Pseudomonas]THG74617.1 flagellar hook-basal body complex protein FliE [Pseudomonas sp. A-1]WPP46860.1 flagellar hook-basal body complex protein FliE [Pseudomonas sp. AN-1]